jgi:hypothetical protein
MLVLFCINWIEFKMVDFSRNGSCILLWMEKGSMIISIFILVLFSSLEVVRNEIYFGMNNLTRSKFGLIQNECSFQIEKN